MPKVKYIHRHIKVDHTRDLIRTAMNEQKLTYETLGPKLGYEPQSLANKMQRGSDLFKIDFLRNIHRVIGISVEDLSKAIAEDIAQ